MTGNSSLPHLGNRVFSDESDLEPKESSLEDLSGLLDVSKYPLATSDIVALMVLEHQCKMHTLMNAAAMNYRRALHFMEAINPGSDPNSGSAGQVAESWADKIVEFIKSLGYSYVTLDILGYRMGSLNESLGLKKEEN